MTFFSDRDPYIIAEVGQNHQGSVDTAFEYIKRFAFEGANAVKFQVRDNKYLFSSEAYNKPYESENAFAPTYGLRTFRVDSWRDDPCQKSVMIMSIS